LAVKKGIIASSTRGSIAVVAWSSIYIGSFTPAGAVPAVLTVLIALSPALFSHSMLRMIVV
jgi:hypothetical protein